MSINFNEMNENEQNKAVSLLYKLITLDWEISNTECGVNIHTGNVYVYNEDEPYTLFIDLANDLMACKTDYETGEEDIIEVGSMSRHDLEKWASKPITV